MAADQNISKFLFEIVLSTVTAYFSYFFLFFFFVVFNSECAAPRASFIHLPPGTGIGSVP